MQLALSALGRTSDRQGSVLLRNALQSQGVRIRVEGVCKLMCAFMGVSLEAPARFRRQ
jgi:hypothetical protein